MISLPVVEDVDNEIRAAELDGQCGARDVVERLRERTSQ